MAKKKIKQQIQIPIGYDVELFEEQTKEINKCIGDTGREIKLLKDSLAIEWNAEKFNRAQELAQRKIEATEEKVNLLKKAMEGMEAKGEDSTLPEAYEKLRRELTLSLIHI